MAYQVKDFADIINAVMEELKLQSDDSNAKNRIKRHINMVYLDEVVPFRRWTWLSGNTSIEVKPYYGVGTVAVTPDSTTITFSVPPSTSVKGYLFSTDDFSEVYKITAHTAGQATATLATPYTSSLAAAVKFKVWTDKYALPTDCRETVEVWHDFARSPLEGLGIQDMRRRQSEKRKAEGRPVYYTTFDYEDAATDSATGASDRYRVMMLHPALYTNSTTIHLDYIKDASPLDLDGDEPMMPLEDRIVLVYGALARAWISEGRNPEASAGNMALYQAKLARMAGRVEDSNDKPQITVGNKYISDKRGPRGKVPRLGAAGFGGGGSSYTVPTYLKNSTIEGANLTANVTAAPGVTVDGRDISADGATLDSLIASASGAHAASAITVTPSGSITATNVQAALQQSVGAVDTHVANPTAAHAASAIAVTPTGNVASTNVQAALAEIQGHVDTNTTNIATNTSTISTNAATVTAHTGASSNVHGIGAGNAVVGTGTTQTLTNKTLTAPVISSPTGLVKADVGLGNVDNTSDATKNAAVATLTNKTLTAPVINSPTGIVKGDVGLGNVDNTSDATKNAAVATLTNKTIDAGSNTISNIANANISTSAAIALSKLAALGTAKALQSNASTGLIEASAVTNTELGFVSGVTSAIQTQLDAKVAKSTLAAKGTLLTASGASTPAGLAVGTDGLFLKADSSQASGLVWASASANLAYAAKTANYTLTGSDDVVTGSASGGAFTLTLPTAVGATGKVYRLVRTDQTLANAITIATTSSQTIGAYGTSVTMATQGEAWTVVSDGANWQVAVHTIPSIWTAYTPTLTNFGSVTNTESAWKRVGDMIFLRLKGVTGTSSSTLVGQFGLPTGLTTSSTLSANEIVGPPTSNNSGSASLYIPIAGPSQSYISYGVQNAATQAITTQFANVWGNTVTYSLIASVQITGWNG